MLSQTRTRIDQTPTANAGFQTAMHAAPSRAVFVVAWAAVAARAVRKVVAPVELEMTIIAVLITHHRA
tara:strand:- start:195 stop:398 length:204 start_codon:yes stop_codon:yes gene_type:complete